MASLRTLVWLLLALLVLSSASCRRPSTYIHLRVCSDMPHGPAALLTAVRVTVLSGGYVNGVPDGGMVRYTNDLAAGGLGSDAGTERPSETCPTEQFVGSLNILPLDSAALGAVTLEAEARHGGATLFATRAVSSYVRDQGSILEVFLADRCRDPGAQSCPMGQTCGRLGCEPVQRAALPSVGVYFGDDAADRSMDAVLDRALPDAPADALPEVLDAGPDAADAQDAADLSDATDAADAVDAVDAVDVMEEPGACTAGSTRPCYTGPAGTQGVGTCAAGVQRCEPDLDGQVTWGDCHGQVLPTPEQCDGRDHDCNGMANNGCQCPVNSFEMCYSGPPGTAGVGICRAGIRRCVQSGSGGSFWLPCSGEVLPLAERCGTRDDANCNGRAGCDDSVCASDTACVPVCMPGTNRFTLQPGAEVLFLTDRSGSMNTTLSGGSTRWRTLRTAMRAVLPALDTTLTMGLVIFPDPSGCTVASSPTVPLVQPSATAILTRLDASPDAPSAAATPTLDALQTAHSYFAARPLTRPRFVVLATDGEPNCGGDLSAVLTELRSLRSSLAVDTFVLGIPGTDTALMSALNQMADAGGRALTGSTRYYDANTASALESSLRSIVATAQCLFPLARAPRSAADVTITVDGTRVPRSTTGGWDFTDGTMRMIRMYGPACAMLNDGRSHTIQADYTC